MRDQEGPDNCLHCWLAPEIERRGLSGTSTEQLIASLLQSAAELIASAPPPERTRLIANCFATLPEWVEDSVRANASGVAIPASTLRH